MGQFVYSSREQTLGELLAELWQGKFYVLFGLVFGGILAAGFLFLATPHYRAGLVIAPASPMESLSSQSSNAAEGSLRAQSAAGHSDVLFTRFEAMYKGQAVANLLFRDEAILNGLRADHSFGFSQSADVSSPAELADYIAKRVIVDPVGETPLRELQYYHADPAFAVLFLSRIHEVTDGLIRYSMRRDVNERIAYLQESLGKVMNPDHRRALTDLLLEQERLKMLVSIDQPYAASIVEPPAASANVMWPDKALVLAAFMIAGAFLGFVIFSIRSFVAEEQEGAAHDDLEVALGLVDDEDVPAQSWIKRDAKNNNKRPEDEISDFIDAAE